MPRRAATWPRAWAIAIVIAAMAAGRARASAPASWRVPAECGGSAALAARVAAQAGRPLTDAEPISVDVAISARPAGGYLALVDVISVRGAARRQVEGADCGAVVDAVALVLALAMADAPAPREVARSVVVAAAPLRFLVGGVVGVDRGALPAPAPGAAVVIALVRGAWRLELGGEVYRAAFASTAVDPAQGVDVGLLGGRARLCRRVGPVRACVGAALGRLEGRPVELDAPSTESRRWSAVTAGVGWSYRFAGRFAIGLDVDGVAAIDRPEFVLSDDTRLHQPAAVGVRMGGGLEVEIR